MFHRKLRKSEAKTKTIREFIGEIKNGELCAFGISIYTGNCICEKIQKHFQNVMLVGMASEISKNYTYKCVDRSRHNGIKGAKAKCAH